MADESTLEIVRLKSSAGVIVTVLPDRRALEQAVATPGKRIVAVAVEGDRLLARDLPAPIQEAAGMIDVGGVKVRLRGAARQAGDAIEHSIVNVNHPLGPEIVLYPAGGRAAPTSHKLPVAEGALLTIGRSPTQNTIAISTDPSVSERHIVLTCRKGRHYVKDLGSRWGTLVNNVEIKPGDNKTPAEHELQHRDVIVIGNTRIQYITPAALMEFSGPLLSGTPARAGAADGWTTPAERTSPGIDPVDDEASAGAGGGAAVGWLSLVLLLAAAFAAVLYFGRTLHYF